MKTIIHDLDKAYDERLRETGENIIYADGKYAPCQGCFACWTKHPGQCYIKDSLQVACRVIGMADELVILSQNCYGTYSPQIKNVLDRSIGISTPLSVFRGRQMHHALRYGKKKKFTVYTYGVMTVEEEACFRYLVERNAVNLGYCEFSFQYFINPEELKGLEL